MTSIPLGLTEPWLWDQQNPSEDVESFQQEASALPTEAPEKMEPSPNPQEGSAPLPPQQEASAQSTVSSELLKFLLVDQGVPDKHPPYMEYVQYSLQQKSSSLPHVPLASVQPSTVQQQGPAQPLKSSVDVVAQPSVHYEITVSPLGSGEAQHPVLPVSVKDVDLVV